MLIELGIVIGLFVIAQSLPVKAVRLKPWLGWITISAAALMVTDFVFRGMGTPLLSERSVDSIEKNSSEEVVSASTQATAAPVSDRGVEVTRADGGSIVTSLGYGIAVAKGSGLNREWIAIHHAEMPIALVGTPGVRTVYSRGDYRGDYYYRSEFQIEARQAVTAFDVRFLIFDVWGEHVQTLEYTEVVDVAKGAKRALDGKWSVYSENDVEQQYASIVYVARVRLADGKVVHAAEEPVIREARKFSEKFTAEELEPKTPSPPAATT